MYSACVDVFSIILTVAADATEVKLIEWLYFQAINEFKRLLSQRLVGDAKNELRQYSWSVAEMVRSDQYALFANCTLSIHYLHLPPLCVYIIFICYMKYMLILPMSGCRIAKISDTAGPGTTH